MQDQQQPRQLKVQIGPMEVDWAKTIGYYGGVTLAVAAGVIEWPLGLFIAGVPFYKMLQHPDASLPVQTISDALEGAAMPVGGAGAGVIKITPVKGFPDAGSMFGRAAEEAKGIWADARKMAG